MIISFHAKFIASDTKIFIDGIQQDPGSLAATGVLSLGRETGFEGRQLQLF